MKIIITGSIAYDYLMSFPGSFTQQILPEHAHKISLSFLVDSMDKRRGGCAPNIAYTIALLGGKPTLMGTAGQDFPEYRHWLETRGVDTSLVKEIANKFTASFFCNTDLNNNQISSFYTGAMAHAGELSFADSEKADLAIISPNDPAAMTQYAQECKRLGIKYIFDPGWQVARADGDWLKAGLMGSHIYIVNDYEIELTREKTGMSDAEMLQHTDAIVVTRGANGSTIILKDGTIDIPVVPEQQRVDPVGAGDAYRGGLMRGLTMGANWETAGRMGSVAATFCLENEGGMGHSYSWSEFAQRYESNFGPLKI
jgi:adenosine kinase